MAQVFDPINDFAEGADEVLYQQGLVAPQGAVWKNGRPLGVPAGVALPPADPPALVIPATVDAQEAEVRAAVLTLGPAGYMLLRALQMLRDAPSVADLLDYLRQGEALLEAATAPVPASAPVAAKKGAAK